MSLLSAERLSELRQEKGVSQKSAAADLGVSQALLSHYEKGIREFSLDFLSRAADYYEVTADYILGRSDSRAGLTSAYLEDIAGDEQFSAQTVYRAAILTHERMNAGSLQAGEKSDLLYAITVYRTLYCAAQKGYIPKRWFSLPPRHVRALTIALTEDVTDDFPEKNVNARRYGGAEPKSIETLIRTVEATVRKAASALTPTPEKEA